MTMHPQRRNFIRKCLALLLLACAFTAVDAMADANLTAADWKAIRKVITDQRAALVAGEAEKAFAFAAPGIRSQVGSADAFMTMVASDYEAIITARDVEFLEGDVVAAIVVQPLRLVGRDNSVRVALYTMEKQANGSWRISGCRMAPSTGQMI
jgi:hypothetical protein